jgi:hypothetical protein
MTAHGFLDATTIGRHNMIKFVQTARAATGNMMDRTSPTRLCMTAAPQRMHETRKPEFGGAIGRNRAV